MAKRRSMRELVDALVEGHRQYWERRFRRAPPTVLGAVEDHKAAWVKERIATARMLFAEEDKKSPFQQGAIAIMAGESIENYLVLDPSKPRANGEMRFVAYDYTEKEDTFNDFYAFLENALELNRALLKSAKR